MNRRRFLLSSIAAGAVAAAAPEGRVTVLLVDTDRVSTPIDERIYGQFLEHINHSVEDGLFAEQIRGAGFEGVWSKNSILLKTREIVGLVSKTPCRRYEEISL